MSDVPASQGGQTSSFQSRLTRISSSLGTSQSTSSSMGIFFTGIFQNERVLQLFAHLKTLGDQLLNEFWDTAKSSSKSIETAKTRFLNGLNTIDTWGEDVQTDEAKNAVSTCRYILPLYEYALKVYIYEILLDQPEIRVHIRTPGLGVFLKFFYMRLAKSDAVKTLLFFSPQFVGIEKEHCFMDCMRCALMDCSQLAVSMLATGGDGGAEVFIPPPAPAPAPAPSAPPTPKIEPANPKPFYVKPPDLSSLAVQIEKEEDEEEEEEDEEEKRRNEEREKRRERRRKRRENRHKRYEEDGYSEHDEAVIQHAQTNPKVTTWVENQKAPSAVSQQKAPSVVPQRAPSIQKAPSVVPQRAPSAQRAPSVQKAPSLSNRNQNLNLIEPGDSISVIVANQAPPPLTHEQRTLNILTPSMIENTVFHKNSVAPAPPRSEVHRPVDPDPYHETDIREVDFSQFR